MSKSSTNSQAVGPVSARAPEFEGHTPGPWRHNADSKAERRRDGSRIYFPCVYIPAREGGGGHHGDPEGYERLGINIGRDDMDECCANARLIAAAPDLLREREALAAENVRLREALEAMLFQVVQGKILERDACVTQARAALAGERAPTGINDALDNSTEEQGY